MRLGLILLLALALTGCVPQARPPATYDFSPTISISADYDAVWAAVVEYFAVANLTIQTIEKDSGLIVTDWMDASNDAFCDCGGTGMMSRAWVRGKFNVFVKNTTEVIELRVTCTYQQSLQFGSSAPHAVNCNSTGFLEQSLQSFVQAKVGQQPIPEVPSFRPGSE